MADSSDSQVSFSSETEEAQRKRDVDELKRDLEGWRQVLIPVRDLMMWERPYHPAVIFGVTTLVFAVIWILEPSVLTTFSMLFLVIVCADFAVPLACPFVFPNQQWTGREEQQFEDICERILHFRTHIRHFILGLGILKAERPKTYFILVMITLATFAWIGNIMNNLYMTYFIVLTVLMIPGLKQKGLLQRYVMKYIYFCKHLLFGRQQVIKEKTK